MDLGFSLPGIAQGFRAWGYLAPLVDELLVTNTFNEFACDCSIEEHQRLPHCGPDLV